MRMLMLRVAAVVALCLGAAAGPGGAQEAAPGAGASPPASGADAGRLQALEGTIRTLTQENERLRQAAAAPAAPDPAVARAADLERQLQAAQERLAAAERGAADAARALTQARQEGEAERAAATQRATAAEAQARAAGQQATQAEARVRQLEETAARADTQAREVEQRAARADAAARASDERTTQAEARVRSADERAGTFERQLAAAQDEGRKMRLDLDAAAGEAKRQAAALADAEAAGRRSGEALQAANGRAETTAAELATARGGLAAAERDAQTLQASLRDREDAIARFRADLLAARNDLGAAQAQVQARGKETEAMATAARELVAGQKSGAAEIDRLRRELAALQGAADRLQRSQAERDALSQADAGVRERLFGAVREALATTGAPAPDGDRLVLPPELAFPPASAVLPQALRRQVVDVGRAVAAAAGSLPPGTDWLLQVEGHTDRTSVGGRVFRSNRALAAARAVSVADALAEGGVPPERLAAVGFGEFRPLDPGDTVEALRRNRRIELRVTGG